MRCPNCAKFVGLETQDPEAEDPSVDGGAVTVEVRVVRACADCGTELKEVTVECSGELDEGVASAHDGEGHELELEVASTSAEESGGGRYKKNIIGVDVEVTVTCSCEKLENCVVTCHGEEAAGSFEEMV